MKNDAVLQGLKYGNAAYEVQRYVTLQDPYFDLRNQLTLHLPHRNDSFEVLGELEYLKALINTDETKQKHNLYNLIDRNVFGFINRTFVDKMRLPFDLEIFNYLVDQIAPLTAFLKDKYNRPRPFQLAYYLDVHLFPHQSVSAWSASYPSGHSLQTGYICYIYSQLFDDIDEQMTKVVHVVAKSREALGLHYPSDNYMSAKILDAVKKHPHTEKVIEAVRKKLS